MYAVLTEGVVSYLGNCQTEALKAFNRNPNSTLHNVATTEELEALVHEAKPCSVDPITNLKEDASEAFTKLVDKLNEWGVNQELATKIKDGGEKVVTEVRSLGIKGMKTVGEGFMALGELLRKASEENGESHEPGCSARGPFRR